MRDPATFVPFKGIRPARLSIRHVETDASRGTPTTVGLSGQCLPPRDRTAPSPRKAERPLAARSVAKGRMRMPSQCWSSQPPAWLLREVRGQSDEPYRRLLAPVKGISDAGPTGGRQRAAARFRQMEQLGEEGQDRLNGDQVQVAAEPVHKDKERPSPPPAASDGRFVSPLVGLSTARAGRLTPCDGAVDDRWPRGQY